MPEPSKESLACGHPKSCERIIQRGCDVCPDCVHTICGWCEQVNVLRQQNAAMVSALREIDEWLYRIRGMCFSGAKSPNQMREELQKILALYAPAEAEAKEKP